MYTIFLLPSTPFPIPLSSLALHDNTPNIPINPVSTSFITLNPSFPFKAVLTPIFSAVQPAAHTKSSLAQILLQILGVGGGVGTSISEEEVVQRGDAMAKGAMVRKMRDFIAKVKCEGGGKKCNKFMILG
jgi:hypothetical protein